MNQPSSTSSILSHTLGDLSGVAHQLYQAMKSNDRLSTSSASARLSQLQRASTQVEELLARLQIHQGELVTAYGQLTAELSQSLTQVQAALRSLRDSAGTREAYDALREGYERYRRAIAELLGDNSTPPPVRMTNLKRSLFHMFWGLFAVFLAERFFGPRELWWIAATFAVSAWSLELTRRLPTRWGGAHAQRLYQRLFGSIMHAQEMSSVSSGTWYATAVLSVASFFSETTLILAVLTLAVGDPIAGIVGRRFGRHKLTHNRTVEGSGAFLVSATLSAYLLLRYAHPEVGAPLVLAMFVALGGTIGELLSAHRLDDNLTVPIGAALGGAVALSLSLV